MSVLPPGFEKRKTPRLPLAFDPRYRGEEGPEIEVKGGGGGGPCRLIDISAGGIGLVAPCAFAKNAAVEVVFDLVLSDGQAFRFQAGGIVRFCGACPDGEHHRVGLEFTDAAQDQKKILAAYIEDLL
ncbi:MAG: PilZ domain-containing protein [Deltaproteobacteria bacterium]